MTSSQIEANIERLVEEALRLRENREDVEEAQAELDAAKCYLNQVADALDAANKANDLDTFFQRARSYRLAERRVTRATDELRAACSLPHQWGRYLALCIEIGELRHRLEAARAPSTAAAIPAQLDN